ncbi:MAG: (Fe-S)-binding protein [Acidobacteriota bacterium]
MSDHDGLRHRRSPAYIEDPLATTELCRFSLMCRHVCPVGNVTYNETLTPHGWALTISSVKRNLLQWNEETVDVLYKCADCGLCRSHCATDQPLPIAIAAARAQVVELGLAPAQVAVADQALRKWRNPYAEEKPQRAEGRGETALFVGDAAQHLSPATLEAAVQLLKAAGISAVLIGAGRSSGFLASSLGLPGTASKLAREVVDEVRDSGCRRLFVLSPGDLYAFKTLYIERLNILFPEEVEVVELTSFLAGSLCHGKLKPSGPNPQAPSLRYAYHDPCHSPRVQRDHQAPRRLLEAALGIPSAPLFWREQRASPCGAVGGLEFTQPDIASKLAQARFEDASHAGADLLITEDPLCLHHLKTQAKERIQVKGLYQILAEHL